MDLKMPGTSPEVWPAESPLALPMNSNTDPNEDSPQEIQEREELAAELEAMMDAAVQAEAAAIEACIQDSDEEVDMDIDESEGTDTDPKSSLQEKQGYEHQRPLQEPAKVLPSNNPPLLLAAPLVSNPAPRYPYLNRSIRVPISPAQKIIAQQFLTESRYHLKQTSAGGHSRLGDEEKAAANLKVQTGTARDIPEPTTVTHAQSGTQWRQGVRQSSDTVQMIPAPADDPGMHLNEMWRDLDRPSTVDERRTFYGNSRRRRRRQKSS